MKNIVLVFLAICIVSMMVTSKKSYESEVIILDNYLLSEISGSCAYESCCAVYAQNYGHCIPIHCDIPWTYQYYSMGIYDCASDISCVNCITCKSDYLSCLSIRVYTDNNCQGTLLGTRTTTCDINH